MRRRGLGRPARLRASRRCGRGSGRTSRRCARSSRHSRRPRQTRPRAEHTDGMGDLFSDAAAQRAGEVAPLAQRLRPRDARRVRRPAARARRRLGAAARDRGGPRALVDLLRAARRREDDARAHRRGDDGRRVRGAVGGVGDRQGRPRGARARPGAARHDRQPGRSSSSTRSTASTRRSRTRCCRRSRRASSR